MIKFTELVQTMTLHQFDAKPLSESVPDHQYLSNLLDIAFIHGDIHGQMCKKNHDYEKQREYSQLIPHESSKELFSILISTV